MKDVELSKTKYTFFVQISSGLQINIFPLKKYLLNVSLVPFQVN